MMFADRRLFLDASVLIFGSSTTLVAGPAQPDILLIMADDLGAENPACYGNTGYSAPHLRKNGASHTVVPFGTHGDQFKNAQDKKSRSN